jgi:protein-S-isoprenylcysteine O-methyltransferase Ste14
VHLLGDRTLGALILCLLGILVGVKRLATGSVLDERPDARFLVQGVNAFNLAFLLVVNPVAAVLLLAGRLPAWDLSRVEVPWRWLRAAVEAVGVGMYVVGCALMIWALLTLRSSYQLGGMAPRSQDALVVRGPYALVRHPMYTAALAMALGLGLTLQSLACLAVFVIYLVLLHALMPVEEAALRSAYGETYEAYARTVPRLIPFRPRT